MKIKRKTRKKKGGTLNKITKRKLDTLGIDVDARGDLTKFEKKVYPEQYRGYTMKDAINLKTGREFKSMMEKQIAKNKQQGGHHLYKRLGVSKYASQKLIRKAFKTLKKKRKANKKVKEAYKILSNKKTRKQYNDRYRKRSRKGGVKKKSLLRADVELEPNPPKLGIPPRKKEREEISQDRKNFLKTMKSLEDNRLAKPKKHQSKGNLEKRGSTKKSSKWYSRKIPKYRPDITPKGKEEFSKKWQEYINTVPYENRHLVNRVMRRSGKDPYKMKDYIKYITFNKYATEQDRKSIKEIKKKEVKKKEEGGLNWDRNSADSAEEKARRRSKRKEKKRKELEALNNRRNKTAQEIINEFRKMKVAEARTDQPGRGGKRKTRKRKGGNENCYGFRNLEDSKLCNEIHLAAQYYNTSHPERLSTGQKIARKIKNRTTRRNRPKPETPRQVAQQKQATFLEFKDKLQPVLAKLKENEDNIRADLIETIEGPDDPTGEKQRVLEAEYDEAFSKTNEKLMLMKEINANLSSDKSLLPEQIIKARNNYNNRGRPPLEEKYNYSNFDVLN